jgi:hypothetical protein
MRRARLAQSCKASPPFLPRPRTLLFLNLIIVFPLAHPLPPENISGFFYVDYLITFSTPVSQFGLAVVGPQYLGNTLTAYDTGNQVLESLPVPYDSGGTASFFAGFVHSSNDIAKVVLSHVDYDYIGIDNVSYYLQPVPAPPTLLLLGSGLLGLVGLGRRKFFPKS